MKYSYYCFQNHAIKQFLSRCSKITGLNKFNIKINDNKIEDYEDDYIVIAIDSTGIKVTNRGQWMRDKWNIKKERICENTCSSKYQKQENSFDEGNCR